MADFQNDLTSFYRMMEMADVYGAQAMTEFVSSISDQTEKGQQLTRSVYEYLINLLINADSKGVYPSEQLAIMLKRVAKGYTTPTGNTQDITNETKKTFRHAIRLYSTNGKFDMFDDKETYQNSYYDFAKGEVKQISSLTQVLGTQLTKNLDRGDGTKKVLAVHMCSTPLLTPQMRNTSKVEFWLNNIPSYVASRLTPYLDVKFQFERFAQETSDEGAHNTTFGLLKFLQGANLTLEGANKAMFDGNTYDADQGLDQYTSFHRYSKTAGMEVFLAPQTMVNPNEQGYDDRFVEVIDKFRPLASLKSVEIGIQPLIGFMTYKNGTLTFVLHDRSRMHEVADMIRPQLFKGTTLWITYGWRHSIEQNNPYAQFVNQNMMMREAFMVVNSEFSFDNAGQVEIKLHIATHGARTAEAASVIGTGSDVNKQLMRLQDISHRISYAQQRLGLEAPQGIKDEVRAYELIDYATRGAFPDMDQKQMGEALKKLDALLTSGRFNSETQSIATQLKADLKTLYKGNGNEGKFDELLKNTYERATADKFAEVINQADPFLPNDQVINKFKQYLPDWFDRNLLIAEYQNAESVNISTKNINQRFKRRIVSFGKLFTVFVGDALSQLEEIDEVQLFFYKLNDNCGPASSINIAEFPIEISAFMKKYNDYVYQKRAENVTIKEFLSLLISSQFTDPRSLGFGMRGYYEAYDAKSPDPKARDKTQKDFETALAARQAKYGVFKYPSIQVLFETVHARSDEAQIPVDLLQVLEYADAPNVAKFNNADNNRNGMYKRIMRIHVYDKAVDIFPCESRMLRDAKGGVVDVPPTPEGKALFEKLQDIQRRYGVGSSEASKKAAELVEMSVGSLPGNPGKVKIKAHDVQPATRSRSSLVQLNDEISKRVPTIHYGSNGTTITNASLSTKADARVSTVNMIRPVGGGSQLAPNGGGAGGLPVRVIPAQLSMTSLGCPLAHPAQTYYIDFKTGTTCDALYILTNVTHTIAPGKFDTQYSFSFVDGYAKYEGIASVATSFTALTGI